MGFSYASKVLNDGVGVQVGFRICSLAMQVGFRRCGVGVQQKSSTHMRWVLSCFC